MADAKEPAAPATKPTTAAELSAAFPELCTSIRTEGADAERTRITGIENLGASMKGHDALIAEMKADGKTTPEQAAVRIVAAEGVAREKQLKGVRDVETHTKVVAAAPQGGISQPSVQASTPEGWAAEFEAQTEAGAGLRAEFGTKERYITFKKNEGKVHIFGRKRA